MGSSVIASPAHACTPVPVPAREADPPPSVVLAVVAAAVRRALVEATRCRWCGHPIHPLGQWCTVHPGYCKP